MKTIAKLFCFLIAAGVVLGESNRLKLPADYVHFSHEVRRDGKGNLYRSSTARREFMKLSGYPKGRPGYNIDHIVPLKRGGPDCPCNMQWIPIADKKIKDKYE